MGKHKKGCQYCLGSTLKTIDLYLSHTHIGVDSNLGDICLFGDNFGVFE